jgi:formiminotetrahydrofolate cyclodeaminase
MADSFLDVSVSGFLDAVASREPAPGGGSVAGVTLASAAGLVAMAARLSEQLQGSAQLVLDAEAVRRRSAELVDADAEAYAQVLATYRATRESDPVDHRNRIRAAYERATFVPLELAELGVRTVELAVLLAERGNSNLRGDAVTAAYLAEAAVQSAAELVRINVRTGGCDEALAARAEVHTRRAAADLDGLRGARDSAAD